MKIIAICGSPRKGNTEFVLKRILTKVEEFGAKTELVLLREKRIEFCDGCLSCDSTGQCKIRDDMQIIYPRLEENDVIIFGSPNYFESVAGIVKNFIDRLNPYYTSKKLNGKKLAAVIIGQESDFCNRKVINYLGNIAEVLGIFFMGDLSLVARNPQDVENDPESIKKIDEFAKNLVSD